MKNKKMPYIVKEMNYSGNQYEINGIDLTQAVFYIRKDRELFKIVAPGDYTITNDGTNTYLVINSAVLTDIISVQVIYFLETLSGKYETGAEPDINILVTSYNKLVDDFKNLWAYVKNQNFVSDTLDMYIVLPSLGEGETWIFKDGEMKAIILYDAIEELKKSVEQVTADVKAELEDVINSFTTNINNLMSDFRVEIQNIINGFETDWAALVAQSKNEINTLTETNKTSIMNLTNDSKTEINTFVTDQKNSITNLTNASKTEINTLVTNQKTNITVLADEKMDEIRDLATSIIGFDPANYYTKSEVDAMLEDIGESVTTIFEGHAPLFQGDFVDCTISGVLANVSKGTIVVTVGSDQENWFDIAIPVMALPDGFGLDIPSNNTQWGTLLLINVKKQGDDLYFSSITYTAISEMGVNKIKWIK